MEQVSPIDKVIPAIMIGGTGTRLWPLSRSNMPKQFLRLTNNKSLFQNTLERIRGPVFSDPWLLTSKAYMELIDAQADEANSQFSGIIVEPSQQGTAAALAAIAAKIHASDPDAIILALPADHVVEKPDLFVEAVKTALPLAKDNKIVTFGIVPTTPETGFGYIRPGTPYCVGGQEIGSLVEQPGGFLEKPNSMRAEAFVQSGYLWNAGIFLFKASTLLKELRQHAPETFLAAQLSIENGENQQGQQYVLHYPSAEHFARCPKDTPIDIAVMEKSDKVAVVPCDGIGWADIGSLSALWEVNRKKSDENGNVVVGDGLVTGAKNCFVHSQAGRKVVLGHVDDMVVIDSEDAVVVLPRKESQRVKEIANRLKKENAAQQRFSRSSVRRWGTIKIDRLFERSQVSTVTLNENSSITYFVEDTQSEIWISQGDNQAEYNVDGAFKKFIPGVPVTVRKGQVIAIKSFSKFSEFTYIRSNPDFQRPVDQWFASAGEIEPSSAIA